MKTYFEKAEKLNVILKRLKSFDLSKLDNRDDFNDLISQKNQLEIGLKRKPLNIGSVFWSQLIYGVLRF